MAFKFQYLKNRQMLKKSAYLLFTLVFLTFIASALFGESGILVNMRVKTEYEVLLRERNELKAENVRLAREIKDLKHNNRKIEALGRKSFGFGRPGEVIFYFPPDSEAAVERYEMGE